MLDIKLYTIGAACDAQPDFLFMKKTFPSVLFENLLLKVIWYSISFEGSILISLKLGKMKHSLPSCFMAYSKYLLVGFIKVIDLTTVSPKVHENWIVSLG